MELNNDMICKSFLPSINARISEFMLLLIVLQAVGSGAGEGAGVGAGVVAGASRSGAGSMGAKPVERGAGSSTGIYGDAHVWISKEVRNSMKLGAEKIRASLRVRALIEY